MYLYYSCYHLPRRMGLLWSGALSEDSIKRSNFTRLPVRISAPQPICRNLWAPWVGLLRMCSRTRRNSYLSPFPSNGHKQKPTIAPLPIYARNTLCLLQLSISFPSFLSYYYCSELPSSIDINLQIRSDRTVFLVFQQTDFNDSTGVGISTSYFCLNYHILLKTS